MTVGLLIMAGAITLFAKISFSGLENTRRVQLNEQLRSTLNLMHKDIQRAGYVDASDGATGVADVDVATMSLFGTIVIDGGGSCITYSYDFNGNNIQEVGEIFGFRLNGGAVERDTSDATCGVGGVGWEDFTDSGVTVTALNFSNARSTEYEVSRDSDGNGTCDSGETCLERRMIDVVITGHVAQEDPANASTLVVTLLDEIKVKNDRYYTVP